VRAIKKAETALAEMHPEEERLILRREEKGKEGIF